MDVLTGSKQQIDQIEVVIAVTLFLGCVCLKGWLVASEFDFEFEFEFEFEFGRMCSLEYCSAGTGTYVQPYLSPSIPRVDL